MACQQLEIPEVFIHPFITVDYINERGDSRKFEMIALAAVFGGTSVC
jgi:hypothetical protein